MTETTGEAVRVMVVDDNPVVRSGLVSLLEASGAGRVVAEAGDGQEAATVAEQSRPELVLLDVRMPLVDGVEAAKLLSQYARVLMLTYTDEADTVRAAIRNGACGYLVHGTFTPEELARAVRDAMSGATPLSPAAASTVLDTVRQAPEQGEPLPADDPPPHTSLGLSAREAEILQLIAQGYSNGETASQLFLSEKTVKNHVNRIYAKLGVDSRGAAIARWYAQKPSAGESYRDPQ